MNTTIKTYSKNSHAIRSTFLKLLYLDASFYKLKKIMSNRVVICIAYPFHAIQVIFYIVPTILFMTKNSITMDVEIDPGLIKRVSL